MDKPVHLLSVVRLNEKHLARLRAVSPRLVVHQQSLPFDKAYRISAEDFAQALSPELEILCTYGGTFDINLAPNLRWVQVNSAGVDFLYDTPLWKSEVAITNASGIHAVQIAEYVLTMLLAHVHHLPRSIHFQTQARWATGRDRSGLITRELRGKTLGILGYGAIGREVARLASTFGMRILATKRATSPASFDGWTSPGTGDPDGSIPERFYDLAELPDLLPECDMVLLALPLSPQTRHILGAAEFALMRPYAFVVNIGRGPLVDTDALVKALQTNIIGGAALDVTEPEPLSADSPLWHMENVIITPHIAGLTIYYEDRLVDLLCENLRRYLHNEPLLNLVQRERGY